MARIKDKEKAIKLRLQGKTYSEIKKQLGISKGTLSGWLTGYPLSPERLKQVRDFNPRRIENFRVTMRKKREKEINIAYEDASRKVGIISRESLMIAGYFLYWAEGVKTTRYTISFANTDPAMVRFFIEWLKLLKIDKSQLRVRLNLYSDMDIKEESTYWIKETGLHESQFRKPYIKQSKREDIKYAKGGFGHGTCNIIIGGKKITDKILMTIRYIRCKYGHLTPLQEVQ